MGLTAVEFAIFELSRAGHREAASPQKHWTSIILEALPMRTWLLYKKNESALSPEAYEVNKLVECLRQRGADVGVYAPEQFELIASRDDKRSVLIDGAEVDIPDVLLPRMGASTTYFALAVIRQLERLRVTTYNTATAIETVKDKLFAHQLFGPT